MPLFHWIKLTWLHWGHYASNYNHLAVEAWSNPWHGERFVFSYNCQTVCILTALTG